MAGILFLVPRLCFASGMDLATQLFEEQDWLACRRECLRERNAESGDSKAELLAALCAVRLDVANDQELRALADESPDESIKAMAAYEVGRIEWAEGDIAQAAEYLQYAFVHAPSHDLFLHAGCTLFFVVKKDDSVFKEHPELRAQLKSCRALWRWPLMKECKLPEEGEKWGAKPGRWVVSLYRAQVGPAIGARCSLEPSCSEYFLQASRKHGLGGVPMIADRLVREPSEVKTQSEPVMVNGHWKYTDPVEDHDWWREE